MHRGGIASRHLALIWWRTEQTGEAHVRDEQTNVSPRAKEFESLHSEMKDLTK